MSNSMDLEIEVSVEKLIKTLTKSRDKHFADYTKAIKGWRKLLRKEVATLLDDIDNEKSIGQERLWMDNKKPEHHLKDYDRALGMLSYAENPTVVLGATEYARYVEDDWEWRGNWQASTSNYIAAGNRRRR